MLGFTVELVGGLKKLDAVVDDDDEIDDGICVVLKYIGIKFIIYKLNDKN
jgi:hypothetical protein